MGSFWDRIAPVYDLAERTNAQALAGMIQAVTERIPAGSRVLECAAGTGMLSLAAAARAGQVLCTDASLPMLEQARRKATRLGLGNISFAQRDLLQLTEADGPFDVAIAANVLHLLEQPRQAVEALLHPLIPGGVLLLPTFLQGEARPMFQILIQLYRILGFRPRHPFTLERYRALLKDCAPEARVTLIPGRLPVGFAVLIKE